MTEKENIIEHGIIEYGIKDGLWHYRTKGETEWKAQKVDFKNVVDFSKLTEGDRDNGYLPRV